MQYVAKLDVDTSPDALTPGWLRLVTFGVTKGTDGNVIIETKTTTVNEEVSSEAGIVKGAFEGAIRESMGHSFSWFVELNDIY